MKLILSTLLVVTVSLKAQKPNFFIEGKISLLSDAKNIIISGEDIMTTIKINPDGTFKKSGFIKKPQEAEIKTDSSAKDVFWLMPGKYKIILKEIIKEGISAILLRTPLLQGPKDATIYHSFFQKRYYNITNYISDSKNVVEIQRNFAENFIDSILKVQPALPFLLTIIRRSQKYIGNSKTAEYLELLNPEQLKSSDANFINVYFKRKNLITKEKTFINFSMKDTSGNLFRLNEVKAKLILIDFWRHDCSPCRAKHKKELIPLYQKYHDKGLEIVSIALDDKRKDWVKAIQQDSVGWFNISELKGWNNTVGNHYYIRGVPSQFWLDADRKIFIDGLTDKEIEEILNK